MPKVPALTSGQASGAKNGLTDKTWMEFGLSAASGAR